MEFNHFQLIDETQISILSEAVRITDTAISDIKSLPQYDNDKINLAWIQLLAVFKTIPKELVKVLINVKSDMLNVMMDNCTLRSFEINHSRFQTILDCFNIILYRNKSTLNFPSSNIIIYMKEILSVLKFKLVEIQHNVRLARIHTTILSSLVISSLLQITDLYKDNKEIIIDYCKTVVILVKSTWTELDIILYRMYILCILAQQQHYNNNNNATTNTMNNRTSIQYNTTLSKHIDYTIQTLPLELSQRILRCLYILSILRCKLIELLHQFIENISNTEPETTNVESYWSVSVQNINVCIYYIYAIWTEVLFDISNELTPVEAACQLEDAYAVHILLSSFPMLIQCNNQEQQTLLHRYCILESRRYQQQQEQLSVLLPVTIDAITPAISLVNTTYNRDIGNILAILLQYPFYINAVDAAGRTPLFYCVTSTSVALLCNYHADPNTVDECGMTPLHQYVLSGNLACVRTILTYGADPMIAEPMRRRNAVHFAATMGQYVLVYALLQGAEFAIDLNQRDVHGNTALHLAAACQLPGSDPLKALLLLLNYRASVNIRNNLGLTVLHLVCANPLLSPALEPLVEVLLQKGADPNAQDCDGCTPLIVACAYREFGVCKAMLFAHGDLNIPCNMYSTFLSQGFVDTVVSDIYTDKPKSTNIDANYSDTKEKSEDYMHTITASDLLPKKPRYSVFSSISTMQSRIRAVRRDRCMNCGDHFLGEAPDTSILDLLQLRNLSGRHHCRHCRRVICPKCACYHLTAELVPEFVKVEYASERKFRVCEVCYQLLTDRDNAVEDNQKHFTTGSTLVGSNNKSEDCISGDVSSVTTSTGTGTVPISPTGSEGWSMFSFSTLGIEF